MAACSSLHGPSATHDHSHGLVADSIKRSREGVRAVLLALGVLALTAGLQALVLVATGSVALLADLIHNLGDASTAIPLGIAFALRSERAERWAGLAVVAAIFASACVAGYEAIDRLIDPRDWTLWPWPRPAWWASEATGSPPASAHGPAAGWTARHSWPTAPTPAPTPT